jgi:hypothetical protein
MRNQCAEVEGMHDGVLGTGTGTHARAHKCWQPYSSSLSPLPSQPKIFSFVSRLFHLM